MDIEKVKKHIAEVLVGAKDGETRTVLALRGASTERLESIPVLCVTLIDGNPVLRFFPGYIEIADISTGPFALDGIRRTEDCGLCADYWKVYADQGEKHSQWSRADGAALRNFVTLTRTGEVPELKPVRQASVS